MMDVLILGCGVGLAAVWAHALWLAWHDMN